MKLETLAAVAAASRRYLGSTVRLVGIGPTDIVDGNVTLTLGMIWSLIVFFMAKDLGDSGDGLSVLKKRWGLGSRSRAGTFADCTSIHNPWGPLSMAVCL